MEYLELLNTYRNKDYIREYWLVIDRGKAKSKLVYQHRRIWEQKIGKIPSGYDIHHVKDRKNNKLNKSKKAYHRQIVYNSVTYTVLRCGNLMCLPKWLHSKAFHNIQDKLDK